MMKSFSISFILLFLLVAILLLYVSYEYQTLVPSISMLHCDLNRLESLIPLDYFKASVYNTDDVVRYYNETTHLDYKVLEFFTGSTAMHTELVPLPYNCSGQLVQLLYLLPYMSISKSINVLEIGFGKGTNLIFLASLFPRANFVGIDLLEKHTQDAKKDAMGRGLTNVTFIHGDARRLQFLGETKHNREPVPSGYRRRY